MSISTSLIAGDVMRFREGGSKSRPGTIEVHIIRPGRGSSGFYSDEVLRKACEAGVYPQGMLMHWDHPTRQQEEDQPARVTGTIAAALAESARYREEGDPEAWDGPGPYALAEVRPKFQDDLKWLAGKIGVSHYVDGRSQEGEAPDGKKGRIITELLASPFNSVDFVTIPGAGGHSKFNEVRLREEQENNQRKKMTDKQESLTLAEIRTKHPEIYTEMKKAVLDEAARDAVDKQKLTEATDKVKLLEAENIALKQKIAEGAAREFIAAQLKETGIPEPSAKLLTESLMGKVPLAADGALDTVKFGAIVTEAVAAKKTEIEAVLKESNRVKGNGAPSPNNEAETRKAREDYRDLMMSNGMTKEQADRLAGIA